MRRLRARRETRPLPDSEFVLFVNHDQSEIRKLDAFLNQRLRSDDELRFSGSDFFQRVLPLTGRQIARQ